MDAGLTVDAALQELIPCVMLEVRTAMDLPIARQGMAEFARTLGFSENEVQELVLVASELASNLIRHAGGGQIRLEVAGDGERRGLRIDSIDAGPGIPDPAQALSDGFSSGGSLGCGLGTVNRLLDDLDIVPDSKGGTHITGHLWKRSGRAPQPLVLLDLGVATRPRSGMGPNGDSFVIRRWEQRVLAGIIDGVGHGENARRISDLVRLYVDRHFDQPLESIFRGVDRVCLGTRGVVMALARFDLRSRTLSYACIGNIDARILGPNPHRALMPRRGILGMAECPTPHVQEVAWNDSDMLVFHSDGVRSRWVPDDHAASLSRNATTAAWEMLRALADARDDATLIVVKGADHGR